MSVSRLVNRNVVARAGRTSLRLEPELWDALSEICKREMQDMNTLVRQVEAAGYTGGRTSAVRVFIVSYFRSATTKQGHAAVGHGKPAVDLYVAPSTGPVDDFGCGVAARPATRLDAAQASAGRGLATLPLATSSQ